MRIMRVMGKRCAAIFHPWVLTVRFFTRTAYLGGADVRQVGQVRQVGHQTAAPTLPVTLQRVYRMCCIAGHA